MIGCIVHRHVFVCFQLKVKATYEGVSTHVVYALVNITVKRNEFTPQFSQGDYKATLLEYFSLGNSVLQVNATDKDAHVSNFISVTEAGRHLMYFCTILFPGGSGYVSDCLAVF